MFILFCLCGYFCSGESFWHEFARIGEIRSIMPCNVKIMALIATATPLTRKVVIGRLCMEDPVIVNVPPTKANIFLYYNSKVISKQHSSANG